ncbi:unnamed protein product [Cyclocybe aegerita]|uniref:Uncharacterized protein n=1 Tax=Cyclocybe aegerita TaxID=1973307 RepID=A0A8S0XED4_CYCAE|nr:unnamed protein product [Cyclocybe aegerita]
MDVYQERAHQDREAARVKLLEPWFVPILALFEGRVIDTQGSVMVPTQFSTGGAVEHEVVMIGGALFLVVEMKLGLDKDDNLVQLFLELLSAAEANKRSGFNITRVYGLLTDLSSFRFYSYDPSSKSFSFDEDVLTNAKRDDFCFDMIYVANKIFSVIMCGYIEVLRATVQTGKRKYQQEGLTPVGSGLMQQLIQTPSILPASHQSQPHSTTHTSLSDWEKGLLRAEAAYAKLQEVPTNLENLESRASEGLKLLVERQASHYPVLPCHLFVRASDLNSFPSARCLPRVSAFTSDVQPITAEELELVAAESVKKWHETFLQRLDHSSK